MLACHDQSLSCNHAKGQVNCEPSGGLSCCSLLVRYAGLPCQGTHTRPLHPQAAKLTCTTLSRDDLQSSAVDSAAQISIACPGAKDERGSPEVPTPQPHSVPPVVPPASATCAPCLPHRAWGKEVLQVEAVVLHIGVHGVHYLCITGRACTAKPNSLRAQNNVSLLAGALMHSVASAWVCCRRAKLACSAGTLLSRQATLMQDQADAHACPVHTGFGSLHSTACCDVSLRAGCHWMAANASEGCSSLQ